LFEALDRPALRQAPTREQLAPSRSPSNLSQAESDIVFDDHGFTTYHTPSRVEPAEDGPSGSQASEDRDCPSLGPPAPGAPGQWAASAELACGDNVIPAAAGADRPSGLAAAPGAPTDAPVGPSNPTAPAGGDFGLAAMGAGLLAPGQQPARGGSAGPRRGPAPRLVVFSGGTAMNTVAGPLAELTTHVCHVLPVSDDGGSTAEIVRVLGGPAVGDIRSRCLRLADTRDAESRAVARLLGHRLTGGSSSEAKAEWYAIAEGDHPLWDGVSDPYKHTIRAFLVHFQANIMRHSSERFDFRNGSVGNFFFAGARTFFRSLEAAIFLFSRVARIPEGSVVAPAILTEERITLGAELHNGRFIRGQNSISHPPGPEGRASPTAVVKGRATPPMPSRVRRIFYLSSEGTRGEHEVYPRANPRVLQQLDETDAVIYGMGSLYTSVCPSLVLRGVGESVAARACPKILVLNGTHDRETTYYADAGAEGDGEGDAEGEPDGYMSDGSAGRTPRQGDVVEHMTASDVVRAVAGALNRKNEGEGGGLQRDVDAYVTALVAPEGGGIQVDEAELRAMGVRDIVWVRALADSEGRVLYHPEDLVGAFQRIISKQLEMD